MTVRTVGGNGTHTGEEIGAPSRNGMREYDMIGDDAADMPYTPRDGEEFVDAEFEEETLGEEQGSARYSLPEGLVKYTYKPVDAPFAPMPVAVTAHVLPGAGASATAPADVYEEVFRQLHAVYPERVARLRDLYFRVKEARRGRQEIEARDEAMRHAFNERNNRNNERLEKEVAALRDEWSKQRALCQRQVTSSRETLAKREAELLRETQSVQNELWVLRGELAAERDERQRESEAKRQEWADEDARIERERAGAQHEHDDEQTRMNASRRAGEREAVLDATASARQEADRAYATVCQIRDALAEARETDLKQTQEAREQAEIAATLAWEPVEAEIRERADRARSETAQRLAERRVALGEARQEAGAANDETERAVQSAHSTFVIAAARAGIVATALDEHATPETLLQRLPRSASGKGAAPEEYLDPHAAPGEKKKTDSRSQGLWSRFITQIWEPMHRFAPRLFVTGCLLVFGAIFGMSLGLLFGAFTFQVFKDGDILARNLPGLLCFFGIGVGVFYAMGEGLRHVTVIAVEAWGRVRRGASPVWTAWAATIFCALVIAGFVILEATIERFGLVDSYVGEQMKDLSASRAVIEEKVAKNEWAYRAIALVASLPFVVLHVSLAIREAQSRIAVAMRHAQNSETEQTWLARTEVRELLAAHGEWKRAKGAQEHGSEEQNMKVDQARLRVEETEAERDSHPDLLRYADMPSERSEFFGGHPQRRVAQLRWDRLQSELDTEPTLRAARERCDYFRAQEQAHSDWLARNLRETGASVAESLAHRLSDTAADAADTFAQQVAQPLPPADSAIETAKNIAEDFVFSSGNRVQNSVPLSFREQAMDARLSEARAQQENDPQVTYLRERIRSLQSRLSRMEEGYKKRITSLKKQRRAIELRPGVYLPVEMGNTETQLQAAQALFEREYARLVRLRELPLLIRWFTHLHQVWTKPDIIVTQVETATRERALLVSAPRQSLED